MKPKQAKLRIITHIEPEKEVFGSDKRTKFIQRKRFHSKGYFTNDAKESLFRAVRASINAKLDTTLTCFGLLDEKGDLERHAYELEGYEKTRGYFRVVITDILLAKRVQGFLIKMQGLNRYIAYHLCTMLNRTVNNGN